MFMCHRHSCLCGLLMATILFILLSACSKKVHPYLEDPFPAKLSAWKLFTGNPTGLNPNTGVVPYDLNTPLFSDYATKYRFIWMPPGSSAVYNATEAFEFPIGTVFSKTFAYPENGRRRLIETRLLVHAKAGWTTLPDVWNEAQTEAVLQVA